MRGALPAPPTIDSHESHPSLCGLMGDCQAEAFPGDRSWLVEINDVLFNSPALPRRSNLVELKEAVAFDESFHVRTLFLAPPALGRCCPFLT
jgi:hypothetical protein